MNRKTLIALGALILVLAAMLAVFALTRPQPQQGMKEITVTVVHADGSEKTFACRTDEETLDKVLLAEGIIPEGNIADGMFTTVDGETASWEKDQAYWSFYVGDSYANEGICTTVVEDGASYKLVYEKSTV